MGGTGHRRNRACYRGGVGLGPARQGLGELVSRQVVVVAGRGGSRGRLDAQLRPDSANPAEIRRGARQAMAVGGRLLRRQLAEHHAAGWAGVVGYVLTPSATHLGRLDGGGVMAAGHVGRVAGGGLGIARVGWRILPGRQEQPVLTAVHPGRLRHIAATGPGGGVAAGAHRGDRQESFVVGQLDSR